VRRLSILILIFAASCNDHDSKDRLFGTLYRRTFIPKDGVTIEFVDSASYIVQWGPDSAKKSKKEIWGIESRLTGTYLIMDSSAMRLETISDSVITFSKGEFNPKFELKN
jgi:hypothetical protein